jgi:hypothetical protein
MSSMIRCLPRSNTRAVRGETSKDQPRLEVKGAETDTT